VPELPLTDAGTISCPEELEPQQTTPPVSLRIAQAWAAPAEIAVAVPEVPSTEGGGLDSPMKSSPQHTTAPLPLWIAQL
jgi:hypothetical protein